MQQLTKILEKPQASKYIYDVEGEVCPYNWQTDEETLSPDLELTGKI
jgi:alkyl hydroperoxide reductase subunit AhpC